MIGGGRTGNCWLVLGGEEWSLPAHLLSCDHNLGKKMLLSQFGDLNMKLRAFE